MAKKDIGSIISQLRSNSPLTKQAEEQGGVAGAPDDEGIDKLAENLIAGGKTFAYGFVQGLQEKIATSPVSASGQAAPSVGDESNDDSLWKKVSDKVMSFKGHQTSGSSPSVPGTNPNVVAEQQAPTTPPAKPNPDEPTGG